MHKDKRIDDIIFDIDTDVIKARKKTPVISILTIVVGIILIIIAGKIPSEANSDNSFNVLKCIGYIVASTGLVLTTIGFIQKGAPYYEPTKEKLKRSELTFNHSQKENIIKYVNEGNYEALSQLVQDGSTVLKVIMYSSANKDVLIAQAFEYIPHSYEPITEVQFIKKS